jgi:hypothetical protein
VPLFHQRDQTGKWWVDHSLSIMLVLIVLLHTALTYFTAYSWEWVGDQQAHGEPVTGLWSAEYAGWFWTQWNLSLVAEPWGVLVIVLLSKWFYERKSAESN